MEYQADMDKIPQKRKKKIPWAQWLAMGVMITIGGVCGFFGGHYLGEIIEGKTMGEILAFGFIFLVGLNLANYIQTIIHEGGHLVFGLLSGYRFSSFRIGSLMWIKEEGRLKLRRFSLAGTGGQCLMTPPDMVDGKIPYFLYNYGGTFANLIAAAIFGGFALLLSENNAMYLFCIMMVLFGIGLALVNGIPLRLGTIDNDGYNAFSLGRTPQALRSFWVQLKVNEQIAKGVRLKDMPEEWFVLPSDEEMKNSMTAVVGVLCCSRLMDCGRLAEAGSTIEHLLAIDSKIVGLHRKLMTDDLIYCMLLEEQGEKAAELYDKELIKFNKSMKTNPSVLRTKYAYALLKENDIPKAEKILEKFEKAAKKYPYPSEIESERELMGLIEQRRETGRVENMNQE